jgi:hypothetical protein
MSATQCSSIASCTKRLRPFEVTCLSNWKGRPLAHSNGETVDCSQRSSHVRTYTYVTVYVGILVVENFSCAKRRRKGFYILPAAVKLQIKTPSESVSFTFTCTRDARLSAVAWLGSGQPARPGSIPAGDDFQVSHRGSASE